MSSSIQKLQVRKDHVKHGLSSSNEEHFNKTNEMFWFPTKEIAIDFANDETLPFTHEGYATAKNNDMNYQDGKGYFLALHNCELK